MARKLHYRVVELKVRVVDGRILVEAWLLIHGVGRSVRFSIGHPEDLGETLADYVAAAFEQVTGSPLPDTPR